LSAVHSKKQRNLAVLDKHITPEDLNHADTAALNATSFAALMTTYNAQLAHADTLAIGVSGGGDSMGLAHMLHNWCTANGKALHILTVDHKLRPDAAKEARRVKAWVENWSNAAHFTLEWQHDEKPQSRIQEEARAARYALMAEHCAARGIKALFIAHNANDQYETFLIRLTSGSGLKGLSAMKAIQQEGDGLYKIRPLLGYSHDDILDYCRNEGVSWIEDPSNQDPHYKRVRLRNSAETLSAEGLSTKRVSTLIKRIERANTALSYYTSQAATALIMDTAHTHKAIDFDGFLQLPDEIALRLLSDIMQSLQCQDMPYPPNSEKLESLYARLCDDAHSFKGATLYKCQFKLTNKAATLQIIKES